MKQLNSIQLLESLQSDVREIMLATTKLSQQDPELLMQQPAANRWSVAQVIAHLNSYGRYYLPAIETSMHDHPYKKNEHFKPGLIGNYFTKMMLPGKNGQIANKMQSPKDHRPNADVHSKPVIDEFIAQQQQLLNLLERAKRTDLAKVRVPVSISKFIKLKMGDTFRFLIAHQQRHFVQIARTLKDVAVVEYAK